MTHPKVSILMLTHNAPECVEEAIVGVATTKLVRYELVVLDNGSDLPTRIVLHCQNYRHTIDTLIQSPKNLLFAAGNNRAFDASNPESKYVLLLNSDVVIHDPYWLAALVEWAEWMPQTWPAVPGSPCPITPRPGPRDIVSYG